MRERDDRHSSSHSPEVEAKGPKWPPKPSHSLSSSLARSSGMDSAGLGAGVVSSLPGGDHSVSARGRSGRWGEGADTGPGRAGRWGEGRGAGRVRRGRGVRRDPMGWRGDAADAGRGKPEVVRGGGGGEGGEEGGGSRR